jgi:uncharacterized protein
MRCCLAASLDLLRARWSLEWLDWAQTPGRGPAARLSRTRRTAGFFYTAVDHEALIQRPKVYADDAMASGNGVAAQALLQLGYLLVEPRFIAAAEAPSPTEGRWRRRRRWRHMSLLHAADLHREPPPLVILRGPEAAARTWQRAMRDRDALAWVFALPSDAKGLPQALAGKCGHPTAPTGSWPISAAVRRAPAGVRARGLLEAL